MTFTVDTQGFRFATVVGVATPASLRLESGYFVLIDIRNTILLNTGPTLGPIATSSHIVTNDPSLCGVTIYTQAKLHDASGPFVLTNAQDLHIGI